MISLPRRFYSVLWALVPAACLLPAGAAHAQTSATVRATPGEVSRALFVAGDVRRLSRNPSGTVDTVLEKVLQQIYRDDPELAPADAQHDIEGLKDALAAAGAATSTATLAVQPGNQRVLAILAQLKRSHPSARVDRALIAVADAALTESSQTARPPGDAFSAALDTQSTLLYGSFSPTTTLDETARLAATNPRFGGARDALWAAVSHQSVSDSATALLANDPDLGGDAVRAVVAGRASDGSLTVPVKTVEDQVRSGLQTINAQNSVAIDRHRTVEQTCPGQGCQDSVDAARHDDALARGEIAAREASLAAAGALLRLTNLRYGEAVQAEGQAAAQIANGVNSYFASSDTGDIVHAASDAAGLVLSLAISEVNPIAALTGVVMIVSDALDLAAPDPNGLILQGLQGVSGQLSAFARATAAQFEGLDARLEQLTQDVSVLADRLSTQITNLHTQVNGLSSSLIALQGSVDRLHSEIQRLFAQDAENDLATITNQSLGRGGLDELGLRGPAGALYTDATKIAQSETVLIPPSAFDAPTAGAIGPIDPNLNFFAFFPTHVSDSTAGTAWPRRALTDTCTGGDAKLLLCLPDPDFWATSSRAYAQLLLENRDAVTRDRLVQLDAMLGRGHSLDEALDRITERDAGDGGTGSQLFNAVIDYYRSWVGRDADRTTGPPTLLQALRAVRAQYIEAQRPADVKSSGPWIDSYGGASQSLSGVDVTGFTQFTNIPTASGASVVPNLRPAPSVLPWLPVQVRNAVRLHVAGVKVLLRARWVDSQPNPGGLGNIAATLEFRLTGAGPEIRLGSLTWETGSFGAQNCAGDVPNSAERTVVMGWTGTPRCTDVASGFEWLVTHLDRATPLTVDSTGFARGATAATPLVEAKLRELQGGSLKALLNEDGTLTHGDGTRASDAYAAAERVGGGQSLLRGYLALGLPQALATDDTLRGLVAGDAANALLHPYGDFITNEPAATVPGQVANYFKRARVDLPGQDPIDTLGYWFNRHANAFQAAIKPYVTTGRAAGQSPADGGRLDESNPLVASTIDRLELSRAVLAAHLDRPAPRPVPTPVATPAAEPTAPSAAAAATEPEAALTDDTVEPIDTRQAQARLVRAPQARGGAIRFTVRCLSGECKIGGTVKAGHRTIGRVPALTLNAGEQRAVTVRLTREGRALVARRGRLRVTVRIRLADSTTSRTLSLRS